MPFEAGPPQLPAETWLHVFGFLPKTDKLSVRLCCTHFKHLVDDWSLWRDDTVVLNYSYSRGYNPQFWAMLRDRRTTKVLVRNSTRYGIYEDVFRILNQLPDLKSLALWRCFFPGSLRLTQNFHLILSRQHVTHLSMCKVYGPKPVIIDMVTRFINLTSLSYHAGHLPDDDDAVHDMITRLPHLKHLSLRMDALWQGLFLSPGTSQRGSSGVLQDGQGPLLTSLELLDYMDPILSKLAFTGLTSLQSLAVSYIKCYDDYICHLGAWLTFLPELTVLSITNGPAVERYARSLPCSLTSLTLRRPEVEPKDLRTVASRVPGLLHLCLDLSHYGRSCVGNIPKLFPHLRTLKLRNQGVPASDLMGLMQLQHLERLEFMDGSAKLSAGLLALQAQTQHRIQVVHSTELAPRDPLTCNCVTSSKF